MRDLNSQGVVKIDNKVVLPGNNTIMIIQMFIIAKPGCAMELELIFNSELASCMGGRTVDCK